MVRRGEYLERSVVVPHDSSTLDGLYHRGSKGPGLVVAPPHPDRGSMEVPVIAEVAWAAARSGHPTLRFNYPGVGASPGVFDELSAAKALSSASTHLRLSVDENFGQVCLAVGWGALVASRAGDAVAFDSLVLIQPEAEVWPTLTGFTGSVLAVWAEGDDPVDRAASAEGAAACANARVATIRGADSRFRAGLVGLGRLIVETL